MTITPDNAAAVITWKAEEALGYTGGGISLNLDPNVDWDDRFLQWPAALATLGSGPDGHPTQAEANTWSDEWAARTKGIKELAIEAGIEGSFAALGTLLLQKNVFTQQELRDALEAQIP